MFLLFYILPLIPLLHFGELTSALILSACEIPFFLGIALWMPMYYNTLQYTIKSDHIRIEVGVWWKRIKTIPFKMITDIKAIQGPFLRIYQLGDLNVQTAGTGAQGTAEGILRGLSDYKEKQTELLRKIRQYTPEERTPEKTMDRRFGEKDLLVDMLNELREIRKKL